LAYSTIVEYSQQEGSYRVPLPTARQTPQLGGPITVYSRIKLQVKINLLGKEESQLDATITVY